MSAKEVKKTTKTDIISYLLSGITVVAAVIAAAYARLNITETAEIVYGISFLVSLAILLLIPLVNKLLIKKLNNGDINVRSHQQELMDRRGEAEKSLAEAAKRTVFLRRVFNAYNAFLILLAAYTLFSCITVTISSYTYIPFGVLIVYALTPLYKMTLRINDFADFSEYCSPIEYKKLHSLAYKAAGELGIKGEIRIFFTLDCNVGIAQIGKIYSLQIGSILLDVIQESELYQMLLHEFAHMSKQANLSYKENRLFDKLSQSLAPKSFTERVFGYLAILYCREHSLYRATASQTVERIADSAVLRYGNPQIAMNGLAKIDFYVRFTDEIHNYMDGPFYQPEEMYKNLADIYADKFRQALPERVGFWKALVFSEIQPRISSHPILRLRMEALGVSDFDVTLPDRNEKSEFRAECNKSREETNRRAYEQNREAFPEERKSAYLEPKATIDEWYANGKPLNSENSREILNALRTLMLPEELKNACDRVIDSAENESETAHALFCKGTMLLTEYDKSGIALIYRAIELNSNYARDGMNAIGVFCCRNGHQAELEEYRERAVAEAQRYEDENSKLGSLLPTDNLSNESGMPDGMLDGILEYIRSIEENSINKIYLVRKTVTESFFASVFVVDFKPDADNELVNRVMGKIFNHLDVHPSQWQFALFFYDQSTEKAVAKVKNCCVYSAE